MRGMAAGKGEAKMTPTEGERAVKRAAWQNVLIPDTA
jgi:hypothetical protein